MIFVLFFSHILLNRVSVLKDNIMKGKNMSLTSIGTHGKISVSRELGNASIKSFTDATVVSSFNKSHLECEKQLMRALLEAYLNSDIFKSDVHELNSNITIKIERSVELVMPT